MSELEQPVEVLRAEIESNDAKLADLDKQQLTINVAIVNEQITASEKDEREAEVQRQAKKLKRANFEILRKLQDWKEIEKRLEINTANTVESYGEDTPIYVEQILDDTFSVEDDEPKPEELEAIISRLTEEYGLFTFESFSELDEEEQAKYLDPEWEE